MFFYNHLRSFFMNKTFLDTLADDFVERNQDKTTFSIRLSIKEDLILQEIAEHFGYSRQELIYRLLNEHVIEPWKRKFAENATLEIETESQKVNYFLLNTNKVNDVADHKFMLDHHYAAAFEDGYKEKINKIKEGDWVFLYESGKGIVAYGQATGNVQKTEHYGRANKTFFQELTGFKKLANPIDAKRVKALLGRSFPFAQTMSRIVDGDKILKAIDDV